MSLHLSPPGLSPVWPLHGAWALTSIRQTQADSTQPPTSLGCCFLASHCRFFLLTRSERLQDPAEYPTQVQSKSDLLNYRGWELENTFSRSFTQRDCPGKQSFTQPLARPSLNIEQSVKLLQDSGQLNNKSWTSFPSLCPSFLLPGIVHF